MDHVQTDELNMREEDQTQGSLKAEVGGLLGELIHIEQEARTLTANAPPAMQDVYARLNQALRAFVEKNLEYLASLETSVARRRQYIEGLTSMRPSG
jgi:vacuolar-type H+-ATPase subunit D/Vma8